MGKNLACLNVEELKQLKTTLERGISKITSKKQEVKLEPHNASLCLKANRICATELSPSPFRTVNRR
nr:transcription factor, K-box [Tanacetum cinerariifolium]